MAQILIYSDDGTLVFDTNGSDLSSVPNATLPLQSTDSLLIAQNGVLSAIANSYYLQLNQPALPSATTPLSSSDKMIILQGGQIKLADIPTSTSQNTTNPITPTNPTEDDEMPLTIVNSNYTVSGHINRLLITNLTNTITITLPTTGCTEGDEIELFVSSSAGGNMAQIMKANSGTFPQVYSNQPNAQFYWVDTSHQYGKLIYTNGDWYGYETTNGNSQMGVNMGG